MHAYAWYVWRKEPRSGPSLKVRVGRRETIATLSGRHADPTPSVRDLAVLRNSKHWAAAR